jgi:hypothetical protein
MRSAEQAWAVAALDGDERAAVLSGAAALAADVFIGD